MTAPHLTPTLPHGENRLTHKGFHYDSPTTHPDSGHSEGHGLHGVVGQPPGPGHLCFADVQHAAWQEGQALVQRLQVDGGVAKQVRGVLRHLVVVHCALALRW